MKNKKLADNIDSKLPNGSCFWKHKWSKWKLYTQPIVTKLGEGVENRQFRICLRCDKIQDREV